MKRYIKAGLAGVASWLLLAFVCTLILLGVGGVSYYAYIRVGGLDTSRQYVGGESDSQVFIGYDLPWGVIVNPPTDVTLEVIDPETIQLTWTPGAGSTQTYILWMVGEYPNEARTNGTLLSFNNDTESTHTPIWIDEPADAVYYYKLWGEDAGTFSATSATVNSKGDVNMLMFSLVVLCLGFTVAGLVLRQWILGMIAAFAWFAFGGWSFTQAVTDWDIYYMVAIVCGLAGLFSIVTPFLLRQGMDKPPEPVSPEDASLNRFDQTMSRVRRMRDSTGYTRRRDEDRKRW